MNTVRNTTTLSLAFACLAALSGCQGDRPTTPDASQPGASEAGTPSASGIAAEVRAGMDKARAKMEHENITIRTDEGQTHKAEITPKGDLIIDGRAVQVTPQQRQLLLDYRAQTMAIASAGMEVGVQGADLAVHAVGEALRGVFSGESDRIEERIKSHEGSLRQAALKLCDRLPALMASQQKLAAAVPEFAPYATMTADDVDDCRKDAVDAPPAPPTAPAPPPPPAPAA